MWLKFSFSEEPKTSTLPKSFASLIAFLLQVPVFKNAASFFKKLYAVIKNCILAPPCRKRGV